MPKNRYIPFAAFTALFAVLAAIVFWGTWGTSVSFVSPDDPASFPLSYADTWTAWWNGFLVKGRILPTDLIWKGLLGGEYFCREIKYASGIYLAGLALAWFLRGRGLSAFASYGAGLSLAFSGYWLTLFSAGHAGWFVWMSYGVFAFALIDRAVKTNQLKWWLLLGIDVAWAGYEQPDLWLLFSAFTFLYLIARLVAARMLPWKNMLGALAVFALVGLPNWLDLVGVVEGREAQIAQGETVSSKTMSSVDKKADDSAARWEFVTNWSLPANETVEFVWPRVNGDTSCPLTISVNAAKKGTLPYIGALGRPMNAREGNYRQHSLYVGLVTVVLAFIALFSRKREVYFFAAAAFVFYLLSLGRYFEPAYRLVFALPAGDLIRCPVKWHHLTEFSLCVLAGYGIETLLGLIRRLDAKRARVAIGALAAVILIGLVHLAVNASLYCAPIDYSAAIAKRCRSTLSVLPRSQFADPQVKAMAQAGYIVPVANWLGNPDAYLVQILEPARHRRVAEAKPLPIALGLLSLLTVLSVFFCVFRGSMFRR